MSDSNGRGKAIDYDLWRGVFASTSPACPTIRKISFAEGNLSVTVARWNSFRSDYLRERRTIVLMNRQPGSRLGSPTSLGKTVIRRT